MIMSSSGQSQQISHNIRHIYVFVLLSLQLRFFCCDLQYCSEVPFQDRMSPDSAVSIRYQ